MKSADLYGTAEDTRANAQHSTLRLVLALLGKASAPMLSRQGQEHGPRRSRHTAHLDAHRLAAATGSRSHYAWYVLGIVTLVYLFSFLNRRVEFPIREAVHRRMSDAWERSGVRSRGGRLLCGLVARSIRICGDSGGTGARTAHRVLDELRGHDLKVREFRIVNRAGRRISGFNQGAVLKLIKGRGMSLPRSALASALYEAVKDRVDVRFGNSVASLEDSHAAWR
jgi:hypothetical protein